MYVAANVFRKKRGTSLSYKSSDWSEVGGHNQEVGGHNQLATNA